MVTTATYHNLREITIANKFLTPIYYLEFDEEIQVFLDSEAVKKNVVLGTNPETISNSVHTVQN